MKRTKKKDRKKTKCASVIILSLPLLLFLRLFPLQSVFHFFNLVCLGLALLFLLSPLSCFRKGLPGLNWLHWFLLITSNSSSLRKLSATCSSALSLESNSESSGTTLLVCVCRRLCGEAGFDRLFRTFI